MRIVLCYRTDIHYVANGLGHTLIFEFRYFQSHCHRCINSSTKQSPFTNIFKSVNPPKEFECGAATGCYCYKKSVFLKCLPS